MISIMAKKATQTVFFIDASICLESVEPDYSNVVMYAYATLISILRGLAASAL